MPTKKRTRLGRPDAAAVVDGRYKQEKLRWRKTRLLCVKLAARGEHTSAQIADLCGVSRGRIFEWLKLVRREGLEALLQREKPGPREGTRRGLSDSVERALNKKLRAGQFCSAVQAQRWLEEAHGIKKPYKSVWNWLKKTRRGDSGTATEPSR